MDAVSDVLHRNFVLRESLIAALHHVARDLAVQGADAVAGVRVVEREDRHIEFFGVVPRVDAPERHEVVKVHAQRLDVRPEVTAQHLFGEDIETGGNGRVCGKQIARRADFLRRLEVHVFFPPSSGGCAPAKETRSGLRSCGKSSA